MPWIFVPRPAHAKGVPLESMVYTNTLSDICPCRNWMRTAWRIVIVAAISVKEIPERLSYHDIQNKLFAAHVLNNSG